MQLDNITIQDCIYMHQKKNQSVIANDGKAIGFTYDFCATNNYKEEIPTQTANPSGDE